MLNHPMATDIAVRTSPRAEPLLAWPGFASLRFSLPLAYLFFKIFFSIYGGTSLLAELRGAREAFHFDWELRLPFVPWLSIVYLSVPLLLLAAPFILRTWRNFTPFFVTLTVETLVAGLFFLVLPMAHSYPEREAFGLGGAIFRLADRLNLDYNEFPSLHIAFAVTAAFVFGKQRGWLGRVLFGIWGFTVCASTLLLHEHHLSGLAGGVVLGLVAVATVQRRASDERVLEALRIEGLCLKEVFHAARRHPRRLSAALSRLPFLRPSQSRPARAAWCLTQNVTDVLGGKQRLKKRDPEEYALAILRGLRGEAPFGDSPAEQLAEYLAGSAGEAVRGETIAEIERALEKGKRIDTPAVLSPEPLSVYRDL
jgi:hypothetical protein